MKTTRRGYTCQHPWPEDCSVQSGGSGVVFRSEEQGGNYQTAFFEAFPRNPLCFIRGEGASVQAAEDAAYAKFQRQQTCTHNFERVNKKGRGRCQDCGLNTDSALPSLNACQDCGTVGAHFLSPLDSCLDEGEDKFYCLPCLVSEAAPELLRTPLAALKPKHLDEDRNDASCWFSEKLEQLIAASLVLDLAAMEPFQALSDSEQADLITSLSHGMFRNTIRTKMDLMDKLVTLNTPGVQYLDEGGLYEALCADPVVKAAAYMGRLIWLKGLSQLTEDLELQIQVAYRDLVAASVTAVFNYAAHCAQSPPPQADQRRRVPTKDEFGNALTSLAEALSKENDKD